MAFQSCCECYVQVMQNCKKKKSWLRVTCFISGDGELVARVAVADDVLGDHADVVSGGRMEVNNRGLVQLR